MELLFVHGALVRDGDWWWHRVAEQLLERTGVPSRCIALPSCGETNSAPGAAGLVEDAQALHAALDEVDDAIVVGHSYGGTVIAEGADHPAVRDLVYITSYLPEVGTSQSEILRDEPDPVSIAPHDDGTLGVTGYDARSFGSRFWQDLSARSTRAEAWERVTTQSISAFVTPTTKAAWRGRPSTYLVCTEDRSTSLELQRFHAARATTSVDLQTGHHPFLSDPGSVADPLAALIARS